MEQVILYFAIYKDCLLFWLIICSMIMLKALLLMSANCR